MNIKKGVIGKRSYFNLVLNISLILASILALTPFIFADSNVAGSITVRGYVGATTINTTTCTSTNTCQLTGFTASNYCQIEGNYNVTSQSTCEEGGTTNSAPVFAFNINWDTDSADCGCKLGAGKFLPAAQFAAGLSPRCCGDEANEYYTGPSNGKSCDGTSACCLVSTQFSLNGSCISFCPKLIWADMMDSPINKTNLSDTVKLYAIVPGILPTQQIDYKIVKQGVSSWNPIDWFSKQVAQFTGTGYTIWKTTEKGNYYFTANISGTIYESRNYPSYGILEVLDYENDIPSTQIIKPVAESKYIKGNTGKTADILFEQISSDRDDDLKAIWNFGDRNSTTIDNILTTGNGNTTHNYNSSGTKNINLSVQEMTRDKHNESYSRIYVYNKTGISVFAIIDEPKSDESIQGRGVYINANRSHAVECFINLATCTAKYPTNCYDVTDAQTGEIISCYKLNQTGLIFEWTFDVGTTDQFIKTGIWNATGYGKVVEFVQGFRNTGRHQINLRVGYSG